MRNLPKSTPSNKYPKYTAFAVFIAVILKNNKKAAELIKIARNPKKSRTREEFALKNCLMECSKPSSHQK